MYESTLNGNQVHSTQYKIGHNHTDTIRQQLHTVRGARNRMTAQVSNTDLPGSSRSLGILVICLHCAVDKDPSPGRTASNYNQQTGNATCSVLNALTVNQIVDMRTSHRRWPWLEHSNCPQRRRRRVRLRVHVHVRGVQVQLHTVHTGVSKPSSATEPETQGQQGTEPTNIGAISPRRCAAPWDPAKSAYSTWSALRRNYATNAGRRW